jgi:8-oxo-dGTP diphosphatase
MRKISIEKLSLEEVYEKGYQYFLRHLSIDCVIFGFHDGHLKVLLLKWKGTGEWSLPGGFIQHQEPIDDAAIHIVNQRTGLKDIYLQQFHAFGGLARQRGKNKTKVPKGVKPNSWMMERFVTIGYWALVEYSKVVPVPDQLSSACSWVDIKKVPSLILDHNQILQKALQSLRLHLNDYPVGKDLLPEKFTMPELQQLYETLLSKKIDRRNFQKKILSLEILEKLKEQKKGGAHKAPYLYRFDSRKYLKALKQGLKFGI